MLNIAFKEWAAVCGAIAAGRQTIIIRKGGIAEADGEFRPEHPRFWLFPTFVHQQEGGTKPAAAEFLAAPRPPAGMITLANFVEVSGVHHVTNLDHVLALDAFHVWTPEAVTQRFHYRTPGLYVLAVRAFAVPPVHVTDEPAYAGCKTWVDLAAPSPTTNAVPVLPAAAAARAAGDIRTILAGPIS